MSSRAKSNYRLICGLEIHVELKTKSKMFCGCANDPFGASAPNIYTCDYCLGRETKDPQPNKQAIEYTIKFGLFTGSTIEKHSYFERKHYQYPDVPKGYQISQCTKHFTRDGKIATSEGVVRLAEAHLEEDVAKMIHREVNGKKMTLIDFNRSGVPLIEIVSQPDIHSPAQAMEYAKNIQAITRYLGMADADMEKGQMRFDANISLQTREQEQADELPSYKVEVKNINSFKALGQAIEFEMGRQSEILDQGKQVPQETRGFDMDTTTTIFQRVKGTAVDFRAMVCPEMSQFEFTKEMLEQWRAQLPLQREQVLADWEREYGIGEKYGHSFIDKPATVAWASELWQVAKTKKADVAKLANYLVNKKLAYQVGDDAAQLVDQFEKLTKVDAVGEDELTQLVQQVLTANPAEVARFKQGEKQLIGFFMGQIMKASPQKLPAPEVNRVLTAQLTN